MSQHAGDVLGSFLWHHKNPVEVTGSARSRQRIQRRKEIWTACRGSTSILIRNMRRVALAGFLSGPVPLDNNRTAHTSAGKNTVEIERPFCAHGHGGMNMQVTPQQNLFSACEQCQSKQNLSLDGRVVQLIDQVDLENIDALRTLVDPDGETPVLRTSALRFSNTHSDDGQIRKSKPQDWKNGAS